MLLYAVFSFFPQGLHAFLHGLHSGIRRISRGVAVGKTALHGEDVADQHRSFAVNDLEIAVGEMLISFEVFPLGQVFADRLCEDILAAFIKDHCGGVEGKLGHGSEAEQAVLGHRYLVLNIGISEITLIDGLASLGDLQGASRKTAVHKTLEKSIKVLEFCHCFLLMIVFDLCARTARCPCAYLRSGVSRPAGIRMPLS